MRSSGQAIATILVAVYIFTASFIARSLYKIWLFIGSHVILGILWVATAAALGHSVSGCASNGDSKHCYRRRDSSETHSLSSALIALSVIDWLVPPMDLDLIPTFDDSDI